MIAKNNSIEHSALYNGIQDISIPVGGVFLSGTLSLPQDTGGLVIFVHGSGSGRFSPRNQYVAKIFQLAGMGTLLFDLLTEEEEKEDFINRRWRFDIPLLACRVQAVTEWVKRQSVSADLKIGYFGASTGAAAALVAAAALPMHVDAVVSRGGRPDLAGTALPEVKAPTLLIVGGADPLVEQLNRDAYGHLRCEKTLAIVAKAGHLFEGHGQLERVADLASCWFKRHLGGR